jgi:hypothetical protein
MNILRERFFHKKEMVNQMEQVEYQDYEWSSDWKVIVEIFDTIDRLKLLFKNLDVPYLREIQQKLLILNLEKYAWSLQNYIIEKYS